MLAVKEGHHSGVIIDISPECQVLAIIDSHSRVGFFNNMPLGATSPAAVWKGAVMRTSPDGTLKDLQCRRSSLANIGVAYLRICVNQHYICSAPLSRLLSVFAVPRGEQL